MVEGYLSNTGPASRIFVVISALLPLESATATILVLNNTRAHTAGLQAGWLLEQGRTCGGGGRGIAGLHVAEKAGHERGGGGVFVLRGWSEMVA